MTAPPRFCGDSTEVPWQLNEGSLMVPKWLSIGFVAVTWWVRGEYAGAPRQINCCFKRIRRCVMVALSQLGGDSVSVFGIARKKY